MAPTERFGVKPGPGRFRGGSGWRQVLERVPALSVRGRAGGGLAAGGRPCSPGPGSGVSSWPGVSSGV